MPDVAIEQHTEICPVNFLIEWVKPLELVSTAFEELVLPSDYKDLVLAYAQQQDEKVQEVDDVIPGKGGRHNIRSNNLQC